MAISRMDTTTHILIPAFNAAGSLTRCLDSIRRQRASHYRCVVIDDQSTDGTAAVARQACAGDDRFEVHTNSQKRYGLGSVCHYLDQMQVPEHDTIAFVDGDDYLADEHALDLVKQQYEEHGAWLTYGSFRVEQGGSGALGAYPEEVVRNRTFRRCRWRASHLKTFRYGLWKHVRADAFNASHEELQRVRRRCFLQANLRPWWEWRNLRPEDLHDASQRYFRRCADKALMFPLLELAGARSRHIPEEIYIYCSPGKQSTQYAYRHASDPKWLLRCVRQILAAKPSYAPLG
jgi:glycosyltransferase involved in cell wall biosynthesis